jgi:hypothetical protein
VRGEKGLIHPVRNMRHVNPVRQSGPIPSYSGTYTMEDIRKIYAGTTFGYDYHYCQMDVDEIMRRVPGVSFLFEEDYPQIGRAYRKTWADTL